MSNDPFATFFEQLTDRVAGLRGNDLAAYENLSFYSRHVMAYGNPEIAPNSRFLEEIYDTLQFTSDDVLVLGPRNSAKSQAVTATYTSWKIGRNPLITFLLAFYSEEKQGLAFSRQIQKVISSNDRYIKIFGPLKPTKPERWTDSEFIVKRIEPPGGLKDPTVAICGLGTAVPSKRADEVVVDDIVTAENAYSETMRNKTVNFMFQTLFPILKPGGRRIVVGSLWDPRDPYAHVARQWGLEFPKKENIDFGILRKLLAAEQQRMDAEADAARLASKELIDANT